MCFSVDVYVTEDGTVWNGSKVYWDFKDIEAIDVDSLRDILIDRTNQLIKQRNDAVEEFGLSHKWAGWNPDILWVCRRKER
jgi:hypothetical protein